MKLATGLWVWVSLLLAAGTVQPNASQSGGSRAVPSRAPVVEPAAAGSAESGGSLAPFAQTERPSGFQAWRDHSTRASSLGFRSSLFLSPNLTFLCTCVLFIVKYHSATLSLFSLSLTPFFLYRTFSVSLSGIPSGRACCAGHGRHNSRVRGDGPLPVRAPKSKSYQEARTARLRKGWSPGQCQLGLLRAEGLWGEASRAGLCTCVCSRRPPRPLSPELAGSDST